MNIGLYSRIIIHIKEFYTYHRFNFTCFLELDLDLAVILLNVVSRGG